MLPATLVQSNGMHAPGGDPKVVPATFVQTDVLTATFVRTKLLSTIFAQTKVLPETLAQ